MGIASYDLDGDGYPEVFLTSQSDNRLQTLADGPAQPEYRDIAIELGLHVEFNKRDGWNRTTPTTELLALHADDVEAIGALLPKR